MPPKKTGTRRNSGKHMERDDRTAERAEREPDPETKRRKSDKTKPATAEQTRKTVPPQVLPDVPRDGTDGRKVHVTPRHAVQGRGMVGDVPEDEELQEYVESSDSDDLEVVEGATTGTTPSGGTVAVPSFLGKMSSEKKTAKKAETQGDPDVAKSLESIFESGHEDPGPPDQVDLSDPLAEISACKKMFREKVQMQPESRQNALNRFINTRDGGSEQSKMEHQKKIMLLDTAQL